MHRTPRAVLSPGRPLTHATAAVECAATGPAVQAMAKEMLALQAAGNRTRVRLLALVKAVEIDRIARIARRPQRSLIL